MKMIGDTITYITSTGESLPALVTNVFGENCLNLVVVSQDATRVDSYGRQLERFTSVVHKSLNEAGRNCWM